MVQAGPSVAQTMVNATTSRVATAANANKKSMDSKDTGAGRLTPMPQPRPPSVDAVVRALATEGAPAVLTTEVARATVDSVRDRVLAGEQIDAVALARQSLQVALRTRPRRLINATGVLLHTNLGRAPLLVGAAEMAAKVGTSYSNLEFDLETGNRGGRGLYAIRLLTSLTGAEAAFIVNNNAAGLFLTLACLANGQQVPVSRGELIEIGGSYRLPELMAASGAQLVEVGTTNRTRPEDYKAAVSDETALLLKVHPSNYRVVGFAEEAPLKSLIDVAASVDIPLAFDAGSGLLDQETPWIDGPPPPWLAGEPGVKQALTAGADLVLFSGDKLLGGPQAGIVVGRADLIAQLNGDPIARAVRTDASTMAALVATLEAYAAGRASEIPFWSMALTPYEELERRVSQVASQPGCPAEISGGESLLGAGSVPGAGIPSPVIMIDTDDPDRAWQSLLSSGIVVRRDAGRLVIDLRAVAEDDDEYLARALGAACRS